MNKSNAEKTFLTRPLVLIGMMGAGKTSIGRAVASLAGVSFFDSDIEIERAAGCCVSDIFAKYGEAEFRRMERQVIARLLDAELCVLSLGGGAFLDTQTRARIKDKATSLWIKVDPALLVERVLRHDTRPLLRDCNVEEKIETLLLAREAIYEQADLTVLCDDSPVVQNAQKIQKAVLDFAR